MLLGCKELLVNGFALNINYWPGEEARSPAEEAQAAELGEGWAGVWGGGF